MASSNPIFARNAAFQNQGAAASGGIRDGQGPIMSEQELEALYRQPPAGPAQTGRMTYDDVMIRTGALFAVLVVAAGIGWFVPVVSLPAAIAGLVLGLVNSFKREPSPALIVIYAAVQGLFLGGISGVLEGMYPGIVIQAVLATFSVFGVMLALFASGKVRVTGRFAKMMMLALIGYAVFALGNFVYTLLVPGAGMFGVRSATIPENVPVVGGLPIGVVIGILAIVLAAFTLVMDFQSIQQGVRNGVPRRFAWTCAFGLMVTLIWLYVEILRLLALLRGR